MADSPHIAAAAPAKCDTRDTAEYYRLTWKEWGAINNAFGRDCGIEMLMGSACAEERHR